MSHEACEKGITYKNRPYREAERELLDEYNQHRERHDISRDRITAAFDQRPYPSNTELQPYTSDWNCDTEKPLQVVRRVTNVRTRDIHRWHRTIGRQPKLDHDEALAKPSSSNGLQPDPSWPWIHADREEDMEKRRQQLEAHSRAMEELRLEAEGARRSSYDQ